LELWIRDGVNNMILNLDTEKITFENYKETIYKIKEFESEAFKVYRDIPNEYIDKIIYLKRCIPIEGIEKCNLYKVEDDILRWLFRETIAKWDFTYDGEYRRRGCKEKVYENKVFMLRPSIRDKVACTCGLTHDQDNTNYNKYYDDINNLLAFHSIKCYSSSEGVVNFWFKPTNLKISWCRTPFRDSYSNQQIDLVYLDAILDFCRRSIYFEEGLPEWIE
jgi:hypothetical protein